MSLGKTQIDRLGDRLKEASASDADFQLLDDFRASFDEAYLAVIQSIRGRGELRGARIKTRSSIVEKLRREKSMKLSRMQDVAGCRIVVSNIAQQELFIASIKANYPEARIVDRRERSSHGYRAVHIVVEVLGKTVEIQVRTSLQQLWAELSEKASDEIDPAIKYGGGPDWCRMQLATTSDILANIENAGKIAIENAPVFSKLLQQATAEQRSMLQQIENASRLNQDALEGTMARLLQNLISQFEVWVQK